MNEKRNGKICALYRAGALSMQDIGERFGISGQRVSQIVQAAGLHREPNVTEKMREHGRNMARQHRPKRGDILNPLLPEAVALVSRGHSYGEAAKLLGLTRSAVAGACYRARKNARATTAARSA